MAADRAALTIAYEPEPGERYGVTMSAGAADEYTLEALQTAASKAFREAVADVLTLYAQAVKAAEKEGTAPPE